ncbi:MULTISPECIES: hypothetical protein [Microbacterium]|uniref:hypothetical protein n=1 Tax=Microbacterium TaxID=33882 RepID=UPI00217ED584|nr:MULTISPECIES: hypothetical protein [Microbacterium]UWF76984.1 hypothetical protein JSY13_09185 [Microbacterium neungamense]WCM55144.1 hypothetical protein JRG78_09195 [Microbacterium sp. EF45047]
MGRSHAGHCRESTRRGARGRRLALLDRDPSDGPADEIGSTRVLGTWVEGEQVYDAEPGR